MNVLSLPGVTFTAVGYGAAAIVQLGPLGTFYVVMYLCSGVLAKLRINDSVMMECVRGELGEAPDKAPEFELELKHDNERARLWKDYLIHEFAELNAENGTLLSNSLMTQGAIDLLVGRLPRPARPSAAARGESLPREVLDPSGEIPLR